MKLFGQGSILVGLVLAIFGTYLVVTGAGIPSLVVLGIGLVLLVVGGVAWTSDRGPRQPSRTGAIDTSRSVWR